jgi:hypothetical protein
VLGGLGVLTALHALRLHAALAPLGVLVALFLGLLSKEIVIVALPLVGFAALVLSPLLHPERPLRVLRTTLVTVAAVAALVGYTYLRRRFFPVATPELASDPSDPGYLRAFHAFLRWFAQPPLPHDPINNPLVNADVPHRVAGALRVYARGLGQVLFPWRLSGDYSFPAEPIPTRLYGVESILGGVCLVFPPLLAVVGWVRALGLERRERRSGTLLTAPSRTLAWTALAALALLWVPVAYFPHSNIPVLLPTVRAERFWYLPAVGMVLLITPLVPLILKAFPSRRSMALVALWFGFQAAQARWHAFDYTDDLIFWRATKNSVTDSAKAHLNYTASPTPWKASRKTSSSAA